MYVFMHQIVFTCTTLRTSEATDAWTDQSQEKLTQRRDHRETRSRDKLCLIFNGVDYKGCTE